VIIDSISGGWTQVSARPEPSHQQSRHEYIRIRKTQIPSANNPETPNSHAFPTWMNGWNTEANKRASMCGCRTEVATLFEVNVTPVQTSFASEFASLSVSGRPYTLRFIRPENMYFSRSEETDSPRRMRTRKKLAYEW
jgi:hypothetical protein